MEDFQACVKQAVKLSTSPIWTGAWKLSESTWAVTTRRWAWRIAATPAWLNVSPSAGSLAPGEHLDLAVDADATGLIGGDYEATIDITSNDPLTPQLQVPFHLQVTGAADIVVEPQMLALMAVGLAAGIAVRRRAKRKGAPASGMV